MPKERLLIVKRGYTDSLTLELRNELSPEKADVIYIDCALYKSTVPRLDKGFFTNRSIYSFQ